MTSTYVKQGIAAAIITAAAAVAAGNAARADGIVSFDVGDSHVCIGVLSCLFKAEDTGGRGKDKTVDHRGKTRDHRKQADKKRENTVVVIEPNVRDHRTKVVVRDHRSKPEVRDHRTRPEVRDHRAKKPERRNTVVDVAPVRFSCAYGANTLVKMGYRAVNGFDCVGAVYHYSAIKRDLLYRAAFDARSGALAIDMIGFAH